MAADGLNKLQIQLIHGPTKRDVTLELPPGESGEVLCVAHLMNEVAKVTGVPVKNQRLIIKGKSLTDAEASLKSHGMKNGSKIMLIGKKENEEENDRTKMMTKLENNVNKSDQKLSDIIHEVDGIHRGFLASNLEEDALKKLGKRLAVCVEEFTRHLETFDSISLGEASQELRSHRKRLVNRVQELLTRCDSITSGIEDMLNKKKIAAR